MYPRYRLHNEMARMREDGYSNQDIAAALDVSYQTVLRAIGKQGGRMDSYAAFSQKPREKTAEEAVPEIPAIKYEPETIYERFSVCDGVTIGVDYGKRIVQINRREVIEPQTGIIKDDLTSIPFEDVPELVRVLAYIMREKLTKSKGDTENG